MTRDDAFALLIEMSRHAIAEESLTELSSETTIAQWQVMMIDDLDVRELGKYFNASFGTHLPLEAWREATEPMKTRTLGDLCELIAGRGLMPVIEPVTVMGDCSLAAGAFLVVRRILCDAGVDVSNLRPSSPIGPYLRQRCGDVMWKLRLLSPGRLSDFYVDSPPHDSCALGIMASWIGLSLGLLGKLPPGGMIVSGVSLLCFWIGLRLLRKFLPHPSDVRVGNTRNFRELCQVLADERLAWPGFPVTTRGNVT